MIIQSKRHIMVPIFIVQPGSQRLGSSKFADPRLRYSKTPNRIPESYGGKDDVFLHERDNDTAVLLEPSIPLSALIRAESLLVFLVDGGQI
jgi:hypothetical protein